MRIAIINGHWYHYEMFGHILEYCKEKYIDVDIFSNTDNNMGWIDLYNQFFPTIKWYPVSSFIADKYPYTVLTSDNDKLYNPLWEYKTRVIVIEHLSTRVLNLPAYKTLQTRRFIKRTPPSSNTSWVSPLWTYAPMDKYQNLTVTCIGGTSPKKQSDLTQYFSNFSSIQFNIINRKATFAESLPNIKLYKGLNAVDMLTIAAKSHYILLLPMYNTNHKDLSMSASVPLSYTVGTPILMSQSFKDAYGYKGILSFSESPQELSFPSEKIMKDFIDGRKDLIQQRNTVFNSSFFWL